MRKIIKHRIKRSIVWKIPTEELRAIVINSTSLNSILIKLNLPHKGGNSKTLKNRLISDNIDFSHIKLGYGSNSGRKFIDIGRMSREECDMNLFIVNCQRSRNTLKSYLKYYTVFPFICHNCNIIPVWDDKPLSLQLDHINGISNDNRLENLRWLCPNCHSQTETFCGKANKRKLYYCKCGNEKCKVSDICDVCYQKPENRVEQYNNSSPREFMRKVIRPDKNTLEKEIQEFPMTILGKKYGVSDNAIKKWCVYYSIDYKNISKFSHISRRKFKLEHPKPEPRQFPSKYLYVCLDSKRNKWAANIKDKSKKSLYFERFDTEIEAAFAVAKYLNLKEPTLR